MRLPLLCLAVCGCLALRAETLYTDPDGTTFDVTDKVNADLAKGFEFCAFRVRSITADKEGNSERKSSFITVENKSMKLTIEE